MTDPIYPLELIMDATCHLTGITEDKFKQQVKEEIRAAGGLLSEEAATFMAADKFGVQVSSHYQKFDDKAWVYNFVAMKSDKERKMDAVEMIKSARNAELDKNIYFDEDDEK